MTTQTTPEAPVELTEYDTTLLPLSTEQARELRRAARGALTVQPDDTPGTWRLTTSHYVGTIVTPTLRILITPKVNIGCLFYLLDFAYGDTAHLVPAFATFYARHLERALARGVPRGYREHQEQLSQVRGRLDIPAQLHLAGLPLPAECRYDDYTADTRLARILRSAAQRLLRLPGIIVPTRQALQRLAAILGEAAPCTPQDLRTPVPFTRLDGHLRPAEHLARMILGNRTLQCSAGTAGAAVFLIDMNIAFESFVAARLTRYLTGRLTVRTQQTWEFGHGGTAKIRPDLIFQQASGKTVYVADTKYKITADSYARDTDYYQILAYATALNVPGGMLIYCQREGTIPPTAITVGLSRTRLDTRALTLEGTPADIEQRLKHLAAIIAEQACHQYK